MRKTRFFPLFFLLIILVVSSFSFIIRKEDSRPAHKNPLGVEHFFRHPYISRSHGRIDTDRILVRFKPEISGQMIRLASAAYQIKETEKIYGANVYSWKVPEGKTVDEMVFLLGRNPDVEYVEPDQKIYIHSFPDDPYFGYQYALFNFGQEIGEPGSPRGYAGADVKALQGWEETKGSPDIVVAVIDTGVDFTHPDLQENILPGGVDFVNGDSDPSDDNGHGTYVCGIIAADSDNHEGISGIAPNCRILPVKGLNADGEGYTSWAIEGIWWAANKGVDVINLSVGAPSPSLFLEEALYYASSKDIVIVSSAGNHNTEVTLPAAYPMVMAVAATDYFDRRAHYSNHGPEIEVAAPGSRILVCFPTWKVDPAAPPYGFISGSSLSCAYVSGLAALIKSNKPWLHAEEIKDVIRFSADDVNEAQYPGWDKYIGYGRINLEKALKPIKIEK
jgi:thermitase